MESTQGSFYYVIPSEIMHAQDLDIYEKHLYALISGLANKRGYCFAGNDWFENELKVGEKKIQRHLSNLEKKGYISRKMIPYDNNPFKKERRIYILASFKKSLRGVSTDGLGSVPTDGLGASGETGIISEDNTLISEEKNMSEVANAPPDPSPPEIKKQIPQEAKEIAQKLLDKIKSIHPKFKQPKIEKWSEEIEKINRIDGHSWKEITQLIDWIFEDAFWVTVIQSPDGLRRNWDKIMMQVTTISNRGINRKKNIDLAMKIKTWLKSQEERNSLSIFNEKVYDSSIGDSIDTDLPHETFKSIIFKWYQITGEKNV